MRRKLRDTKAFKRWGPTSLSNGFNAAFITVYGVEPAVHMTRSVIGKWQSKRRGRKYMTAYRHALDVTAKVLATCGRSYNDCFPDSLEFLPVEPSTSPR